MQLRVAVGRGRFGVGQRITQAALGKVAALGHKHRAVCKVGGPLQRAAGKGPDARKGTKQGGLAAARWAVDQHRIAGCDLQAGVAKQACAVGQRKVQPIGMQRAVCTGRTCDGHGLLFGSLQALLKTRQTVGGGAPNGQAVVVVNEPRQGVLHAPEGRGHLHQLAQLNRATEKARRCHDEGEDGGGLRKTRGEPGEVFLRTQQAHVVAQHIAKAHAQARLFHCLAFVQRNRLGVFAHPHQVVAKFGFEFLLLVVQLDQGPPDEVRDRRAHDAIHQGHPHHEAGHAVVLTAPAKTKAAAEHPQNAHKTYQGHHRIEQAHRERDGVAGEKIQVFLNTLVGVVRAGLLRARKTRQLHPIKRLFTQPARCHVGGHPGTPAHLEQLREVKLVHRNNHVDEGQIREAAQLRPEHVGLLVLQRVIEDAVPVVEQHQHVHRAQVEHHDGSQQGAGFPFFFRLEVGQRQSPDLAGLGFECGEF